MKVILGGGIGGLSAAHYMLNKYPLQKITLYESTNRLGGWIRSKKLPNGVLFEQGPRTIRPRGEPGANTLQLLTDLELTGKVIPISTSHPAAKNRMVYANGQLCTLPNSFQDTLKTLPPFSKPLLLYFLQDLTAKRKIAYDDDESIYNFVERRFGKDIAEYAVSPLICGICAGDAKEISVKFLMKSIFEKEQKYGSVSKGIVMDFFKNRNRKVFNSRIEKDSLADIARTEKWSVYTLEDGLETLPKTLKNDIISRNGDVVLNKLCRQIKFENNSIILTIDGYPKEQIASHVVSSIPSTTLAELVTNQHPLLAYHLRSIPFVTVAVVNIHYKKKLKFKDAFGFLVPPSENIPILGVIFDSCCFPNADNTVLTVMMGGHWFDKLFGTAPKEEFLLTTALEQLKNILNIEEKPDSFQVNILKDCIPQYIIGHHERVTKIEDYIRDRKLPLSICGSSYYGVGVNDVILSAKNAVDSME